MRALRARWSACCIGLFLAIATSDGASAGPADEETRSGVFTPVLASLLGGEPSPVRGSDGRQYVVYELLLTNAKSVPATLERLEVRAGEKIVRSFAGDAWKASLRTLSASPVEDAVLPASTSRILLVTLSFDRRDLVPEVVRHRLTARAAASPAAREPSRVSYDVVPLQIPRTRTPILLEPPLRGSGWLVVNGCCDGGGAHRGAIQTVNGALWNAQRFAIDWMQVDEDRLLFAGDANRLESYAGYGATVYAAAAGTVISVVDGLPEQVPGALPPPESLSLATVDGNSVVLDHGDGAFTMYAHLQKESVPVSVGDRVEAGAELGRLGNSGNTSAPHLHFQVTTGPVPLGSDGVPFLFRRFRTTLRVDDSAFDAGLFEGKPFPAPTEAPQLHANELPLDLDVVQFLP